MSRAIFFAGGGGEEGGQLGPKTVRHLTHTRSLY